MSERETAAREFCKLIGWTYQEPHESAGIGTPVTFTSAPFQMWDMEHNQRIDTHAEFPVADAPLHEHLAFVGRIAEAVGRGISLERIARRWKPSVIDTFDWHVVVAEQEFRAESKLWHGSASDLSWAALLAGTAALRERAKCVLRALAKP